MALVPVTIPDLETNYKNQRFVNQSMIKLSKQYLYIENVIVPANFVVRYAEAGIYRNIGMATLSANIQPAMLKTVSMSESDVAKVVALLKLAPIVVATELVYASDQNPPSVRRKDESPYEMMEVVRFIGVVQTSSITVNHHSGDVNISFEAIDLLNYLLQTSSLYLFGEQGAVAGLQAASSMAEPIIKEIILPILQDGNKYGKALAGLLSLIGLKRKTAISEEEARRIEEEQEREKEEQKIITPDDFYVAGFVDARNKYDFVRFLNEDGIVSGGELFSDDIIEKIASDSDFVFDVFEQYVQKQLPIYTPRQFYLDVLRRYANSGDDKPVVGPDVYKACIGAKPEDPERIRNIREVQEKLYPIAIKAFFFKGSSSSFYYPSEAAVSYAYHVQDANDFKTKIADKFKKFLEMDFRNKVDYFANGSFRFSPSQQEALHNRAKKSADRYGKYSVQELKHLYDRTLINRIEAEFKKLNEQKTGDPDAFSLHHIILAILATENSFDVPVNHVGAGTSAQFLYRMHFYGAGPYPDLRRAVFEEFVKEFDEDVLRIIKEAPSGIFEPRMRNAESLKEAIAYFQTYRDNSPIKANVIAPSISAWKDFIQNPSNPYNAAVKQILKFTEVKARTGGEAAYRDNLFALLYAKMDDEKRQEIDYLLAALGVLINYRGLLKACQNMSIDEQMIITAYNAGGAGACARLRKPGSKKYCGYDENKDEEGCKYAAMGERIYKILKEGMVDWYDELITIDMRYLKEFVQSDDRWAAFVAYAMDKLGESIQKFVPEGNEVKALDDMYDFDEVKRKYNLDEWLYHYHSNLRKFTLQSIIIPASISNWFALAYAIENGLLSLGRELTTVGNLVDTFLNVTRTRIVPVPPMLVKQSDGTYRIILYSVIPSISYAPLPNKNDLTLEIEPFTNRFAQNTMLAAVNFPDAPKITSLYVAMSISGMPLLFVIPLAKLLGITDPQQIKTVADLEAKLNSDFQYEQFFERVLNESAIEKVTPPTFNFVNSKTPLQAGVQYRNIIGSLAEDFNEFSWMFLDYMSTIPSYWAQWSVSGVDYHIPAWYNSIVGFPARLSFLTSGNHVGILSYYEVQAGVSRAITSMRLRNIFHIETQKVLVPYLDPAYPSDLIFVDMFFKASDYFVMSAVSSLVESAVDATLVANTLKAGKKVKEVGFERAYLLPADVLMGRDKAAGRLLQKTLEKELAVRKPAAVLFGGKLPEPINLFNIRASVHEQLSYIYRASMEIGVSTLYYNEDLRAMEPDIKRRAMAREATIFKSSLEQAFVKGLASKWRRVNKGRYGPLSISRMRPM